MTYRWAGVLARDQLGRYLLLRRSRGVSQPGTWSPPGGGIEPGESLEDAALREMWEEAGPFPISKEIDTLLVPLAGAAYLIVETEAFVPRLNWENDAWMWVRPEEMTPWKLHPAFRTVLATGLID